MGGRLEFREWANRCALSAVDKGVRVGRATVLRDESGAEAAAFTSWVRPHWDHMLRLSQRLVGDQAAEDVLQEALAAAWRSRHRFDPTRGHPRAWLLAIVANKAKDHRPRQRLRPLVLDDALDVKAAGSNTEVALDIEAALSRLTSRQRTAVALYYYLGLPIADCSDVMGCSVGTVKSTLSDARTHLERILKEDYA